MPKDWSHDGATALEDVDSELTYSGRVTNVGQYGVFVDFGAVKDALLKVPTKVGRRLKKGMDVDGLTILSIDAAAGKVVMEADESQFEDLPSRPRKPAAKAKSGAAPKAATRTRSRPRRTWDHSGATALEEISVGDVFEGRVTNVSVYGVFVDVGAVRDARLNIPATIGRRFSIGDAVPECVIETVDLEQQRMSASLPDAEAVVRDLPPKERAPRPATKAQAKPKPKAAAAQRAQSPRPQAKTQPKAKAKGAGKGADERDLEMERLRKELEAMKAAMRGMPMKEQGRAPKAAAQPARATPKAAGAAARSQSPKPKAAPKGTAKAAPKATPKAATAKATPKAKSATAKARSASPAPGGRRAEEGIPIEKLRVGSSVDGIVTNKNQYGVFVNIGCTKDARLSVSKDLAKDMRKGDEIYGMLIESVDLDKNQISCFLEDPELYVEEEAPPPRRPPRR